MSNGGPHDHPGQFRTVAREGMTDAQFKAALEKAKNDGYELQVAVFYKEASH